MEYYSAGAFGLLPRSGAGLPLCQPYAPPLAGATLDHCPRSAMPPPYGQGQNHSDIQPLPYGQGSALPSWLGHGLPLPSAPPARPSRSIRFVRPPLSRPCPMPSCRALPRTGSAIPSGHRPADTAPPARPIAGRTNPARPITCQPPPPSLPLPYSQDTAPPPPRPVTGPVPRPMAGTRPALPPPCLPCHLPTHCPLRFVSALPLASPARPWARQARPRPLSRCNRSPETPGKHRRKPLWRGRWRRCAKGAACPLVLYLFTPLDEGERSENGAGDGGVFLRNPQWILGTADGTVFLRERSKNPFEQKIPRLVPPGRILLLARRPVIDMHMEYLRRPRVLPPRHLR